jgi:hypothetical protein
MEKPKRRRARSRRRSTAGANGGITNASAGKDGDTSNMSKTNGTSFISKQSKPSSLEDAKKRSEVRRIESDMSHDLGRPPTVTIKRKLKKKYMTLKHVYKNEKWLDHFQKYLEGKKEYEKRLALQASSSLNDKKKKRSKGDDDDDIFIEDVLPDPKEILMRIAPRYATLDVSLDEYICIHRELRLEEGKIKRARILFQELLEKERNEMLLKTKKNILLQKEKEELRRKKERERLLLMGDGNNETISDKKRKKLLLKKQQLNDKKLTMKKMKKRKKALEKMKTISVSKIAEHLSSQHPHVSLKSIKL